MRNEKIIIYSYLNRIRKLVSKKKENDVTVKTLSEYIIENHDLEHAKCV